MAVSPYGGVQEFPEGVLAYAEVTASQTGISSKVDLVGLAVTIDVAASRRIRISFDGSFLVEANGDAVVAWVQEGTTVLAEVARFRAAYINDQRHAHGAVVLTPSAGSHTYKVTANEVVGTGNVRLVASAASPAFILVEDLGPA